MGSFSAIHWIIVLVIVFLLFGSRLPNVMGDFAKGIKAFKHGMRDDAVEDKTAGADPALKAEPVKMEPGKVEH